MTNEIKGLKIRKWIEYFEETLENETGIKFDDEPIRKYVVGTIFIYRKDGESTLNQLIAF